MELHNSFNVLVLFQQAMDWAFVGMFDSTGDGKSWIQFSNLLNIDPPCYCLDSSSVLQVSRCGAIGSGASSVVQRAIHIPKHRILALKKINIFEWEKRQQLLTEIRTLCEAPCHEGLVDFHRTFYSPDSGQISIALEYMDGGSLAAILKVTKT